MLAMIAHPDKQRKCQEELDAVVGRSRMPTFADRDSLPYICAAVREALRWRPATPVGESCISTDLEGIFASMLTGQEYNIKRPR